MILDAFLLHLISPIQLKVEPKYLDYDVAPIRQLVTLKFSHLKL